MQAAVLADTHMPRGSRRLPPRCVELIAGCDLLLHAGDISSAETLAELAANGPPVEAVHGNVDSPELRARLPERLELELGGRRLGMVHDAGPARGRLARLRRWFPQAEAVVFGHSHIPLLERDAANGFQIFNPGSPTDRRRSPAHTMGLLLAGPSGLAFELIEL